MLCVVCVMCVVCVVCVVYVCDEKLAIPDKA